MPHILKSSAFKALVFDFDGVIVNSRSVMRRAYQASCARHGVEDAPPFELFLQFMGMPLEEIFPLLKLPVALVATYRAVSREHRHEAHLFPGAAGMLDAARQRFGTIGLLTGKDRLRTLELLDALGIADRFDSVVCGDDPLPGKPRPDGLRHILDAHRLAPSDVAMIGDSPIDIACCLAAGCTPMGAGWGFSDDAALAAAHRIFASPQQFQEWITHDDAPATRREPADLLTFTRAAQKGTSPMDALAINGGKPACPAGVIPPWPVHDHRERTGLERVLDSRIWWRVPGREVDAFERSFADLHQAHHAFAVSNGTQAIELALAVLDIGVGDEVIIPAFTFASTATAVLARGALAVPVDVDPSTYCIDVAAVERAITPRTRAIIPVHLAGHPCDMAALGVLAQRHGLIVVGDAAHAHGARWRGDSITRHAAISIFSFQSGKLMTAGEGGALVFDDDRLKEKAWVLHSCGRSRTDKRYLHTALGTNMRMTEFQGAILAAQLSRLPEQLAEREAAAARLDGLLAGIDGLVPSGRHPDVTLHAHYMYMVELTGSCGGIDRDAFVDALVAEGVPAFRAYQAIPDFPVFAPDGDPSLSATARAAIHRHDVPVTRRLAARSLWLHHAVLLGGPEVQTAVASAFAKVVAAMVADARSLERVPA